MSKTEARGSLAFRDQMENQNWERGDWEAMPWTRRSEKCDDKGQEKKHYKEELMKTILGVTEISIR